ncbi:hypothetical protein [Methanobrevibacter sp.]
MVRQETNEARAETSRLFLNSVKSWYPDGILVGVESVSKPFKAQSGEDDKFVIGLSLSLGENMEKCRVRAVKDGKILTIEDEEGNEKPKVEIVDWVEVVPFFFNMKLVDEDKDEYKVFEMSSAFPLFNFAFIEAGLLPKNNTKNIIFTHDELVEVLEGLEFRATVEMREFGGNKYPVLIPVAL